MDRRVLALLSGCVYLALSVWLVHAVGASHREALRRAARQISDARTVSIQPEVLPASKEPPAAATASTKSFAAASSAPTIVKAPEPEASLPPARPPARTEPTPAGPSADPAPSPSTIRKEVDPVWKQPSVTKKWSLASLSLEEENRLGQDLNALILLLNDRAPDGPEQERVEEAARPLLASCLRKDVRYRFFILNSNEVNAFSHPGGFVYVTTGLLEFIGKDEPCALQFVLAHEIAHVDDGHAIRCLLIPTLLKLSSGTVETIYKLIIPLGYTEEQEFQADRWAYERVMALDCGRYDSLKFIRRFEQYANQKGFPSGHASSVAGDVRRLIDNHYRSHPAARDRKRKLEALTSLEPKGKAP
jgi:Zn-dependent protease with chaperone function